MTKQKRTGHKEKLLFWFASFCSEYEFSLRPLRFCLSTEEQFLRFFLFIFYMHIFTDKKSLDVIIQKIIWFLKFFFLLSRFHFVFLPTKLASLPPGVMLLNHSTATRDSATNIEKTTQKGTPEREKPNRSVVKIEVI